MIALVLEENLRTQQIISSFLTQLGFKTIFGVSDFEEARYLIEKEEMRIDLFLVDWDFQEAPDFPIAQCLLERKKYDLSPLLVFSHQRLPKLARRFSRVDSFISKPFALEHLREKIFQAHQHRNLQRSILLVLTQEDLSQLTEACLKVTSSHHWTEVIQLSSRKSFEETLIKSAYRVGAVLIDCRSSFLKDDYRWLFQFKKTAFGILTPLICLSSDSSQIYPFRTVGDLFYDLSFSDSSSFGFSSLLTIISKRMIFQQRAREVILQSRFYLKNGYLKDLTQLLQNFFQLDNDRWEFHELLGELCMKQRLRDRAIFHYEQALRMNPCSPRPYIHLMGLVKGERRREAMSRAFTYCAKHPVLNRMADSARVSQRFI